MILILSLINVIIFMGIEYTVLYRRDTLLRLVAGQWDMKFTMLFRSYNCPGWAICNPPFAFDARLVFSY